MSQCQLCGREIPEGQQLCPTCRNAVEWRQRQQQPAAPGRPEQAPTQAESGPGRPSAPLEQGPSGAEKAPAPPAKGARPPRATKARGQAPAMALGIVLALFLAFFAAALLFGGTSGGGAAGGSAAGLTPWDGGGEAAPADPGPDSIQLTAPDQPQAPAQPPADAQDTAAGEYIFPNSDRAYLTREEVAALTPEQLRLARNEIYARHGRIFQDKELAAYFGSKSWYQPLYDPESFDALGDSILNEYEIANRDLIQEYEALSSAAPAGEQGGG